MLLFQFTHILFQEYKREYMYVLICVICIYTARLLSPFNHIHSTVWRLEPLFQFLVKRVSLNVHSSNLQKKIKMNSSLYCLSFLSAFLFRLAVYFCINHPDRSKATQFSASVGRHITFCTAQGMKRAAAKLWLLV